MSLLLGTWEPFNYNSGGVGWGWGGANPPLEAVASAINHFTLKQGAGVGKQINLIWIMISEMRQRCRWLETWSDFQHSLPSLESRRMNKTYQSKCYTLAQNICTGNVPDTAFFKDAVVKYHLSFLQIWYRYCISIHRDSDGWLQKVTALL